MSRFLRVSSYLVNLDTKSNILMSLCNVFLVLCVSYVVFITGGTKFAYLHLMYAPIVFNGMMGGVCSGFLVSCFAGIVLAFMPHDVEANLPQPLDSVLMRMILFGAMGILSGIASNIFRYHIKEIEQSYLHDYATKLLNRGGIAKCFQENVTVKEKPHLVVCLEVSNSEALQRFVGYNDYLAVMRAIAYSLKKILPKGSLLGIVDSKTFVLVVRKDSNQTKVLLSNIKSLFAKDFRIKSKNVVVQVVIGASTYPDDSTSIYDLINNACAAIKEASNCSRVQQVFEKSNKGLEIPYQLQHVSMLKGVINSGNIGLLYMPIMSSDKDKGFGLYGKIKWPESIFKEMQEDVVGSILDDMHSMRINLVLMFIYRALMQLQKWKVKNLNAKVIIKIRCKDLLNRNVVNKILNNLDSFHIASGQLIIELIREEQLSKVQIGALLESLEVMSAEGIAFIADMALINTVWAVSKEGMTCNLIEFISISKDITIKASSDPYYISLIRGINKFANEAGLKTIALHVDTEQQFDRLMASGCHFLAGSYISKELDENSGMLWLNKYSL